MKISLLEFDSKKDAVVLFFPFNKFQSRAGINFLVSFSATEIASNGLFQTFDYKNWTILDMLRPNGNAAKSLQFTILGFIVWLLLATTVKADMSIEGALKRICSVKLALLYQTSTVCTYAVSDSGKVSAFQFCLRRSQLTDCSYSIVGI